MSQSAIVGYSKAAVLSWAERPLSAFEVKRLTGGTLNEIYLCVCASPCSPEAPGAPEVPAAVIVRCYGKSTEIFFAREREEAIALLMAKLNCGPQVLHRFPGGRVEQFIPGRTLDCKELQNPRVLAKIAQLQ